MIRVGELTKRVQVQTKVAVTGARGEQVQQWQVLFPAWARVQPLSAGQKIAAAAEHPTASHKVVIRYRSSLADIHVLSNMRLMLGKRVLSVLGGIDIDEKRQWYEFTVEEGLNNG
ncbi:phage head closure protein [Undibacterium curvum]|uniref:Phage head closure protein n=1 Tax=Undibacterium curvum TaxID=2762294 RepID=A0ABR7A509_9BURK|nr:phage head closure protein [Undibacterium curvum]MBC3931981.1 phage head closure protein [Undibacterium curvum]